MAFEVKLPDIGEGVAEGEVVRWLVKPGDTVREDQPLVEVMTDKASVEIPSPRAGTIAALHVEEGKVVPVGTVLASIEVAAGSRGATSGAGAVAAAPALPVAALARPAASAAGVATGAPAQATPAVRQLARELGVALESVSASGEGGRITADDVRRTASGAAAHASATSTGPSPDAAPASPSSGLEESRLPLRGLRRRIAETMRRSIDTVAHYTFVAECDMSAVAAHMQALKPRAQQANVPLTYLAYVVKALVEPLQRFPLLNASLDDERHEIVLKRYYHVGMAARPRRASPCR
jgi:pyruvate dehydrogenase E2 component (dihydrolipoamide acetyltransferase)